MLRLSPTRITLGARDVEYHTLSDQQKASHDFERSKAVDRLLPHLRKLRASIAEETKDGSYVCSVQDEKLSVGEQGLRNTVSSDSSRSSSLDNTVNVKPTKGRRGIKMAYNKAGFPAFDGQYEPTIEYTQQTDLNVTQPITIPEDLSLVLRLTSSTPPHEVERLTSRFRHLNTEHPSSNSAMVHEYGMTPTRSGLNRHSMIPQTEPHLPASISHRAQMASTSRISPTRATRAHYSSLSQHNFYASPTRSAYYSSPRDSLSTQFPQSFTPNRYTYSGSQDIRYIPDSTARLNRTSSVPNLVQQYYYTDPFGSTRMSIQDGDIPISQSRIPRASHSYGRSNSTQGYTNVFNFGQSTHSGYRFWRSRNAHARRRNGLFVYEDNLPPEFQPQTPVGLPRHGIPFNYSAYSMTAPPARGPRSSILQPTTPTRLDRRQQPTMPIVVPSTSLPRFTNENDLENAARYAEIDRRRRMRTAGHIAMEQGGHLLDATPPRLSEDSTV